MNKVVVGTVRDDQVTRSMNIDAPCRPRISLCTQVFLNSGVRVYADLPMGYASQLCTVSRLALQCVSMDECALLHVLVEHTFFSMGSHQYSELPIQVSGPKVMGVYIRNLPRSLLR